MNAFKRFIRTVPIWAFVLVVFAITVNSVYLYFKYQIPEDTSTYRYENGQVIYDYIEPGGEDEKAGIKSGDILLSINSVPIETWDNNNAFHAGDSVDLKLLRDHRQLDIRVKMTTLASNAPGFYWSVYFIMLFFNIAGLYILYKKSSDKTVKLFFVYLQLFSVTVNAVSLILPSWGPIFATWVFQISGLLMGTVLVHFHLLFPKPVKIYRRIKALPKLLYLIGALYFIPYAAGCYLVSFNPARYYSLYLVLDRIALTWISLNFFIALAMAILQFVTARDTLTRNQVRIVIIGSFFGFITPMSYAFIYNYIESYNDYENLVMVPHGIGSMIMIACILIAIFRYRIWDSEIFIRKALLYIGATTIITLSYLLLIYLVQQFSPGETNVTRFLILAISVIIFLVLRDTLQRLIDRLFHRESYDSATVVSNFEEKMAGIYRTEDLGSKIVQGLDEIFHFRTFMMNLKEDGMKYEIVSALGMDGLDHQKEIEINEEFEKKLARSMVFSPGELDIKPSFLEKTGGELVVPLLKEDKPYGFLMCGPKKSEKAYSMQDIRVLSLIAKRVIALFHTASLYKKDLDRQLMLERERARISQDMHDDIGAGLTKIAMLSEAGAVEPLAVNGEPRTANGERMQKVAFTARDMINRLNVIVWALNPRYDNLDSLVSYARRYFGEYLENFGIRFRMEVPDEIPDIPVTPDFRRNAFYAWQEAIHNAVKHGACSEVKIEVTMNGQTMQVIITDNGKGFDQARPGSGGNGLLNMKKRAEDLGGSFEIQSEAGKGTRVEFRIPVGG